MLSTTVLQWAQELLDALEGKDLPEDYWYEIREKNYGNKDS